MNKLIRAGIFRYCKSTVFRAMLAASLGLGIFTGSFTNSHFYIEYNFFLGIFLVIAIQISLIIGTEFSNGIVRNNVISGHSKGIIFLSELLLSLMFSAVLFAVYFGVFAAFNAHWFSVMETGDVFVIAVGFLFMHLSSAVICTAICFFISQNTTVAAVVNLVLILGMALGSYELQSVLEEPEYLQTVEVNEKGMMVESAVIPNPSYIPRESEKYIILHTVYYLMPCGQLRDYAKNLYGVWNESLYDRWNMSYPEHYEIGSLKTAPLYSLTAMGLFTAAGFLYFRKKDLK